MTPLPKIERLNRGTIPQKLDQIIATVAKRLFVDVSKLKSRDRSERVALARQIAMTIAYEGLPVTLAEVGEYFQRDHGTVLHATKQVHSRLEHEHCARVLIGEIRRKVRL